MRKLPPFFLSICSLAVLDVLAAPVAVDTCALQVKLDSRTVDVSPLSVSFAPTNKDRCSRSPSFYEPSPTGLKLTPAIAGAWSWGWGNTLYFTPDEAWPSNTAFTLDLSGLRLPPATVLRQDTLTFRTPPLHSTLAEAAFLSDPAVDGQRFITLRTRFSTRVTQKEAVEKAFIFDTRMPPGLTTDPPVFLWLNRDSELLVKLRLRKLPTQSGLYEASLRLPASADGYRIDNLLPTTRFAVRVPATGELYRILDSRLNAGLNDELAREQILTLRTSVTTTAADLLRHLRATALPEKLDPTAASPTDWRIAPVIDDATLARGETLRLRPLQDEQTPLDTLSFAVEGLRGRYLHLSLPAGFGPTDTLRLSEPWQAVFQPGEPVRELSFLQPGHMLSLTGTQQLTLHAEGIQKIRWRIARVRNEFLALQSSSWGSVRFPQDNDATVEVRSGDIALPADARFATLDLRRMGFSDRPAGLFELSVDGLVEENHEWRTAATAQKRVLVTDTALIQKETRDGTRLVFADNMALGRPAAGLEVTLLAANGLAIDRQTTDRNGLATFNSTAGLTRERMPVAVVSHDPATGDMAWLSIADRANQEDNVALTDGKALSDEGLTGLLFAERGLYRPGETVHLGVLVAKGNLTALPEGLPVTVILSDAAGRETLRNTVTLSPEGLAAIDHALSADALPGAWQVRLQAGGEVIAETRFHVRDFDPESMRMRLTNAKSSDGWLLPDELSPDLHLTHWFGTDAADRRVVLTGSLTGQPTRRFAGYPGWTFMDPSVTERFYEELPKTVLNTNTDGRARPDVKTLGTFTRGGTLTLLAEGFDGAGSRSATDELKLTVSPSPMMIGFRTASPEASLDSLPVDQPARLRLMAVNPKLEPLGDVRLVTTLERIQYRTALFEDDRGELRYRPEKVGRRIATGTVTTDANGLAEVTLGCDSVERPDEGDYLLTLASPDGTFLGAVSYRLTDYGLQELQRGNLRDAPLVLRSSSPTVRPGDAAVLTLVAPFDGTALLTLESDTVHAYRRIPVKAGDNTVTFPIPKTLRGRQTVNAHLLRRPDDRSRLQQGYANASATLRIADPTVTLTPTLQVPAIADNPARIPVTISSPTPGRFFIWAVDEGVLSLSNYQTPDPLEAVLWDRALQVKTFRTLHELMPEDLTLPVPAYSLFGGGEDSANRLLASAVANPFSRTAEKAAVWWGGLIEAGPEPTTLQMTLPEGFNGRVRLMAIGASLPTPARLGSSTASVIVREPVVMTGALPRFVTPGDRFTLALTLTPDKAGRGSLALTPASDSEPRSFEVEADHDTTLNWSVTAPSTPGDTRYRIEGTFNDRPLAKSLSLGVRPATLRETSANWGLLGDMRRWSIEGLPAMNGPNADATLTLSAAPMPLIKGLADLSLQEDNNRSPESSIEFAASQLALLNAPGLHPVLGLDRQWYEKSLATLARTLADIRRQLGDRGLSSAQGADADRLATVRALDFVLTLRQAGRLPDPALLGRLTEVTRDLVNGHRPATLGEARLDAYALMLITLEGTLVPEELENLRRHLDDTQPGWRDDPVALFFARAYRAMRMPDEARPLEGPKSLDIRSADDLSLFGRLSPTAALALAGRWGTDIDAQSLVSAILAQSPGTLLAVDRSTLLACLAALQSRTAPERSVANVSIRCTEGPDAVHTADATVTSAMTSLSAPGCRRFEVNAPESLSNLFWSLTVSGYPADVRQPALREGFLVRKRLLVDGRDLFVDRDGKALSEAKLSVGDLVTVEIDVERDAGRDMSPVMLTDLIPGGFEILPEARPGSADAEILTSLTADDRRIWQFRAASGRATLCLTLRATAPGRFLVPAAEARDAEIPPLVGRSETTRTLVVSP